MKKFFIILIFVSFGFLMLSLAASAALEYPLPGLQNPNNPTPCDYIRALYIWGLSIVGAVAVTSIAIGGFLCMTGKIEKGKEIILSALLGLLLLLGSWLLLNTINPDLAKLECAPIAAPSATPAAPKAQTPATAPPAGSASDQNIRSQLTSGISVNKACNDPNAITCESQTCLSGLQQSTLTGINNLKNSCNCSLMITGGTERGCHSSGTNSHENGKKLDLAASNTNLSNLIYTKIGNSNPTPNVNYKGSDGNIYRYETNHWDICFEC